MLIQAPWIFNHHGEKSMRKSYILIMAITLFSTQSLFAFGPMKDSKSCGTVAKACLDAGFQRADKSPNMKFWFDCMKPLLLGQKVNGVTIDAATVNTCRSEKIDEMKKELNEFENVK